MVRNLESAEYGSIRATNIEGNVFLCLLDICKILEIENSNELRISFNNSEQKIINVSKTKVKQSMIFVSEDVLSICLTKSHKADAEMIMDWVYRVVVPEIKYMNDYNIDSLKNDEIANNFLTEFEALKIRNHVMSTTISINSPRLTYLNKLLGTEKCVDMEAVIKVIKYHNIRVNELFRILRASKVLNENNEPYQNFCDKRYFRLAETKVTELGQQIISKRVFVYPAGVKFIEKLIKGYDGGKYEK